MIHGTTVILYNKREIGKDGFNRPVYDWKAETVDDILIGQPSDDERKSELDLNGRRIEYVLGIPKGDSHEWENCIVEFFGHKFQTFGIPVEGIEANIPLRWHKKVKCERYE